MQRAFSLSVLVIILTVIAGGFFFLAPQGDSASVAAPSLTLPASAAAATREIPPGSREYRSEKYQFSLLYPDHLTVTETDEGGGAATITFENADAGQGFQMYILPYAEEQVSTERFSMDVPSGVRERESAVSVGDVQGSAFYSRSDAVGETFEVWFIRRGLLYETMTLAPLDSWLLGIMGSLIFI
jgi:hypothetical protein